MISTVFQSHSKHFLSTSNCGKVSTTTNTKTLLQLTIMQMGGEEVKEREQNMTCCIFMSPYRRRRHCLRRKFACAFGFCLPIIEALIHVSPLPPSAHNLSHYKCYVEDAKIMMKLLLRNKLQYDV